ncbi:MAG TPA: glycosyltransferase family 87 protein, partial [Candidatus Nanoarchaeia archaeon]|nr:glycosyltransferase family 87 protein [Candidatus Nanoarchaeia archaeon]
MSPLQFLCSRNGKRLLAALLILTFVHMVYSGVYKPLFVLTGETFGQLQEEMEPLRLLIGEGRSITLSNPRQYGPVFLATMMPVLLLTDRALLIERTAWVFCIVAIGIAFVLTVKMLPVPEKYRNSFRMLLGILWFNFSSLYYILGVKGVEAWELLLISIACLALARRKEFQEFHAGIAIAAATLIKLLPGIFFVPLLIRNPKAFWKGIAWLFVLLLMGQFLFGKWIGLAYLPGVLRSGAGPESWAAAHFENNSLKGMVYKWFSGFESMPDYPQLFQLAPETAQAAFICSAMLQVLLMISIVWLLWRERKQQNRDATLRAFGLTSGA